MSVIAEENYLKETETENDKSLKVVVVGDDDDDEAVFVPLLNFAMVDAGIYRSAYPENSNFSFIETLNLKSIIYLCPEPYPEEHCKFHKIHNIKLYQFGIEGKKETGRTIPGDVITNALKVLIDVRNHPALIYCNRGK